MTAFGRPESGAHHGLQKREGMGALGEEDVLPFGLRPGTPACHRSPSWLRAWSPATGLAAALGIAAKEDLIAPS